MITRANAAKFAGISRSVAKFKEIREKVNKNKMPSVVKFRRQLQAAAEATLANKGSTPNSGIGASHMGTGISSVGGNAAVTYPIRIDDPHCHPRHGQRLPLKQHQPVMTEGGQDFMRLVMEDVIKANRFAFPFPFSLSLSLL